MKKLNYGILLLATVCLTACQAASTKTSDATSTTISETSSKEITNTEQVYHISDESDIEDERFKKQPDIIAALEKEREAHYTLDDAQLIVDPFGLSPLTAVVIFESPKDTKVDIVIKGKDDATTIKHTFDEYSKEHIVPVYGLYAGIENEIIITEATEDGEITSKTFKVLTDDLPEDISKTIVEVSKPEKMKEGLTFFDCPHVNGNYFLAIDANGDIRWYLSDKSFNGSVMLTHLKNGNLIIGSGKTIPDTYNNLDTVYEITPLGEFVKAYHIYGIHHDIREESNGNLIFAASKEGRESQNDYIVEVDRNTGKVLRDWDLMEIIPMTEYDTQPPYTGGLSNWLHNNAIWYIEDEDAFIISGRHQNMIMKFGATDKKIKWILSGTVGELNEKLRPYLLTPVDEDFEYPTSQHAAMQTPEGDLMLFDNRNFDVLDDNGELIQDRLYSRAVRYKIDEDDMTIEEVWEYGKEQGGELYSSFVSDVDYLGENHYLIDFGGMYKADDGSNYDHIYTDSEIKNKSKRNSIVVEIANDEVVYKVTLTGNSQSNSYKAERKDIYQNAKELSFGK